MGITKQAYARSWFEKLKLDKVPRKLSELEQPDKEETYRMIVEKAFEGIAVARGDKLCFINESMMSLTGRSSEELLSQGFIESVHPDDRAMVIETYTKRLKGEDARNTYTLRITTKDGQIKWIQANASLIKWEGEPASLAFLTDISLQKKFEEILRESEKKFRGIVSNSALGIYETNLDGKILYLNDAMLNIIECDSLQELLGTNVTNIYKDKNDRNAFLEMLKINGYVKDYEIEIVTKTGKVKTIMLSATLVNDNISGTITDISVRKKAEITWKEAQNTLNALINATEDDIVLLINPDGKVLTLNEMAIKKYGSTREKIIGRNVYDFMPPELSSRRKAIASKTIKNKKPVHYMEERLGRFYKCTVYPIFYDRDNISSLAIFARDVTELKLTEKELLEVKKNLEHQVKKRTEELERKTQHLEETNIALKVLLEKRNEDKNEMEEKILTNLKELVLPYLEKVKRKATGDKLQTYLEILETNLTNIISPFAKKLSSKYMNLTASEIKVANLVKHGKSTKEVAELLNVSVKTVETHRMNIRKKLAITNKKANLRTCLLSLENE